MTRSADVSLPEGRSLLRFEIVEGSLESVSNELTKSMSVSPGEGLRVLAVQLVDGKREHSQERAAELSDQIAVVDAKLATANQLVENAQADLAILDVFGQRIVEGMGNAPGTGQPDLDEFER